MKRPTHFIERLRPYRSLLWGVSVVGLFGINGVFLYYAALDPAMMGRALRNPIAAAFILEAVLMTILAAWLVHVSGLQRPGWGWFVVLSIVGSLAFGVPAFMLLHLRNSTGEDAARRLEGR
jgi:hypothetical protein